MKVHTSNCCSGLLCFPSNRQSLRPSQTLQTTSKTNFSDISDVSMIALILVGTSMIVQDYPSPPIDRKPKRQHITQRSSLCRGDKRAQKHRCCLHYHHCYSLGLPSVMCHNLTVVTTRRTPCLLDSADIAINMKTGTLTTASNSTSIHAILPTSNMQYRHSRRIYQSRVTPPTSPSPRSPSSNTLKSVTHPAALPSPASLPWTIRPTDENGCLASTSSKRRVSPRLVRTSMLTARPQAQERSGKKIQSEK